jgi:MoaA/NifB/PqqE/SkfB family radical SAM enzyme
MVNLSWLLERLFELHGALPRLLWKDGRAFSPIHMLMEVTYRCNLRCNFCQYLDIIEGHKKPYGPVQADLSFADIARWIDAFPRGRLISFTGGETLVRRDFPEILAYASRHHRVHLITNGALIDAEVARKYIELAPRRVWQNGLVLLEVSLQGDEHTHDRVAQRAGSWRKAVEAVRHLVRIRSEAGKRFPKFDLKIVVTRNTVAGMVEFMYLAKSLGVDLVNFLAEHDLKGNAEGEQLKNLWRTQRTPEGVDADFLRRQLIRCYELERELGLQIRLTPNVPIDEFARHYTDERELRRSEYVCEGVWSRLGLSADGRTGTVCPYFATGDMRQVTLRQAWNGERLRAFRSEVQDVGIYPGCNGCCNLKYVGPKRLGLLGVSEDVGIVARNPPYPETTRQWSAARSATDVTR